MIFIEILQIAAPDPLKVDWSNVGSIFAFILGILFFAIYWLAKDRSRILKALKEEQVWSRNIGEKSVEYITKVESSFTMMHSIKETGDDTNRLAREIKQQINGHNGRSV